MTKEAYAGDGEHVNSGFFNGLNNEEAIEKMIDWLEENGNGKSKVTYRLARLAVQPSTLLGRTDPDHPLGRRNDDDGSGRRIAA